MVATREGLSGALGSRHETIREATLRAMTRPDPNLAPLTWPLRRGILAARHGSDVLTVPDPPLAPTIGMIVKLRVNGRERWTCEVTEIRRLTCTLTVVKS